MFIYEKSENVQSGIGKRAKFGGLSHIRKSKNKYYENSLPKSCDQAISKSLAGSLSDYHPKTTSWEILSQIANPLVALHLLHSTETIPMFLYW